MNRPSVWRALLALLVVGITGFFAVTKEPTLGLDLRGGTQIVLETRDSPTTEADAEATDRALEVLRRRVDALGVAEPTLARSGNNRIIVELPGVDDPAAAEQAIGRTAQLTFHPVLGTGDISELPPEEQQELEELLEEAGPPPGVPAPPGAPEPGAPAPGAPAPGQPAPGAPAQPAPAQPAPGEPVPGAPDPQPTAAPAPGAVVDAPAMVPVAATAPATEPAPTPESERTAQPTAQPTEPAEELVEEPEEGGLGQPRPFDPTLESQSVLSDQGDVIRIGPAALTGEGVSDAAVVTDPTTGVGRYVSIDFRGDGGREWERITAEAACQPQGDPRRRVAIVLDGEVITSPQVETSVPCGVGIQGGTTRITGNFTQEEASNLAVLIKGGALPVPVETISRSFVGPTLGEEAIEASWKAGLIGVALTGLFLIVVYRLAGFLATLALASYGVISYGTLVALGATLTLPGLGGLLLSAGLAIDANVLVYERTREEFAAQRKPRLISALDNGFAKAFSAIADSNVTTILAAALLFFLAAGPVRGFGVTLTIGVLASMVSALLVTRVLAEFAVKRGIVFRRPAITGFATLGRFRQYLERRQPDLIGKGRLWLTISAALVLVAIAGMLVRGFNFGIEFTGGRTVEYATSQDVSVNEARRAISEAGFPTAVVQEAGNPADPNIAIRTGDLDVDEEQRIADALRGVAGEVELVSDESVGPTLGSELRTKAFIALAIALLAQLVYLAVRFRWAFATSAVIAMLHDVVIVMGLFAWLGKPIDSIFLAAALTIIGVSINDSIVTLDRIRETWGAHRTRPLPGIVNSAVLQTAPRTINTGLGAMFILAALAVLGGDSLRDFALALLVGFVVGTYSSAFTASPLLILLEKRSGQPPPMPKRKSGYSSANARRKGPQPIFQTRGGGAVR